MIASFSVFSFSLRNFLCVPLKRFVSPKKPAVLEWDSRLFLFDDSILMIL